MATLNTKNETLLPDKTQNNVSSKPYPSFIVKAMEFYFEERVKKSWQGGHILKGTTPNDHSLIFSSNDYLSISKHPNLINAQIHALQQFGNGQLQSAVFLSDHSELLNTCEQQLSDFLHYPSALLAQSGWCANVGLIQAIAQRGLPVYLDFYTHMSFWAGVKAAGAKPIPFFHNSPESLAKRLERHGPGIITIDSIYSTTGAISPLIDYVKLAKHHNSFLIVDESHSLGTHGPQGRGLVAALGLTDQVDVITASLAKTFSGRGGIIVGNQSLIEYLRYSSLPSIFSSALAPHDLVGFCAALDIIQNEEWRREKLHANAQFLNDSLIDAQINIQPSKSQIIPLITGSEANALWLRNELEQEDIYGSVFCSPATPKNKTLIRLSLNAQHEQQQLSKVVDCLVHVARKKPYLPCFDSVTLDH